MICYEYIEILFKHFTKEVLIHLKKLQSALGLRKNITLESRELLILYFTFYKKLS